MKRLLSYLRYMRCLTDKESCDKYTAFRLVTKLGGRLLPRYRFNFPEIEWWDDSEFNTYLKKFDELHGYNSNRRWMLKQLLRTVAHIDGDTAECGVFRGASNYLILSANKRVKAPKIHHIFDSFEGLSEPNEDDGSHWSRGNLAVTYDEVVDNLSPFAVEKDYKLYRGWIPDRFIDVESKEFSFVHIDVDLYQPTLDSFRFFFPRLKQAGVLLCDDYGFETCPGARKAANEYFADTDEKMIELPDGGGCVIKGCPVAE